MKILAMYLPQFHQIPENDTWWGKGFTEWTAVKNAKPLFEEHYLPRIPKDNYYYDLLKKETMKFQEELMHQYGVDGMVFYHYYFKEGRKVLEKPAENLLKWKDIDMPFCFSWANETWARSWSRLRQKNVWFNDEESRKKPEDSGILLQQSYGNENDWRKHFFYLLPFFKDKRYIKKDGKPIFLIYKTDDIACLPQMLELWRKLSIENGFPGLYVISSNSRSDVCDAQVSLEPGPTLDLYNPQKYKNEKLALTIEYDEVVSKSIELQRYMRSHDYYGSAFPGFDDSPRRVGTVVVNSSPELFYFYLKSIIQLGIERKNEFVFINAWNEWGESMYLEPDEQYGFGYLEAVRKAKYDAIKEKSEVMLQGEEMGNLILNYEKRLNKYRSYWKLFDNWLTLKEQNKELKYYLLSKGFRKIAIYGIGMVGQHLLTELENTEIEIAFGIDGKGDSLKQKFPVYTLNDELPRIDGVIVTVGYEFQSIKQKLQNKGIQNIISLEQMIGSLLESESEI